MQPSEFAAERALLGAILLRPDKLGEIRAIVGPEDFREKENGQIFEAIESLKALDSPIDALTVGGELERRHKKPMQKYLLELLDAVPTAENAKIYAEKVAEESVLRAIANACKNISSRTFVRDFDSVPELLAEAQTVFSKLSSRFFRQDYESIAGVLMRTIEALVRTRNGGVSGFSTGLCDLDSTLGGLRPTELVIVAGRPAMGKTAFAMSLGKHAASNGVPVLVFSLEMGSQQIAERLIASESSVELAELRRGCKTSRDSWERVMAKTPKMGGMRLWLDESSAPTIDEIKSKATRWSAKETKGEGIVIVDYLQLVRSRDTRASRQQQLGEVSRGLKSLAKELKMPVIGLAQLNRECEKRDDKRPLLGDLREAGDIEQDADVVLMLYRDEVYHENTEKPGTAEVIIRKHRNGPTGFVELAWNGQTTSFANLAKHSNGYDYVQRVSP